MECPTDEIENEKIDEVEEVTDKIIQLRAEISSVLPTYYKYRRKDQGGGR